MSTDLRYVTLGAHELARVAEIDRTERIDAIYVQHGSRLELVLGDRSSPPWDARGDGDHSVAMLRRALENWVRSGATMRGSFAGERLVGIGGVLPHVRARRGAARRALRHQRLSGPRHRSPSVR